jgi:hypothetical protein
MRAKRTLVPGQQGTKNLLRQYGSQLVSVRYRYDTDYRLRFRTVELMVEQAGGRWNHAIRVWQMAHSRGITFGLKDRIAKPRVSNSRHPKNVH